eukprot:gene4070-4819_t
MARFSDLASIAIERCPPTATPPRPGEGYGWAVGPPGGALGRAECAQWNTHAQITFDDKAQAFLRTPANYYLEMLAPQREKADADLYAWKGDLRFNFDHPVMRDVRFGVRATKRTANRVQGTGSEWYSISRPWEVRNSSTPGQPASVTDLPTWGSRGNFTYLSDPRVAALVPTSLYTFDNFFNGKIPNPGALVVP